MESQDGHRECLRLIKNNWEVDVVDETLIGNRNEKGGSHKKNGLTELHRSNYIGKDLKHKLICNDSCQEAVSIDCDFCTTSAN